MPTKYLAPEVPLRIDENNNFVRISDSLQNVRQKLRMLFLTNPGEKIMSPNYGIGIRRVLFENSNNSKIATRDGFEIITVSESIKRIASEQISEYLEDVTIINIDTQITDNIAKISLQYTFRDFINDVIDIEIT
jgi:phage baseplate assembly protein W